MQSGLLKTLNSVLGATKLWRGPKDAILWPVYAGKVFATCAVNHGSLIIKTISSVTYLKKEAKIN